MCHTKHNILEQGGGSTSWFESAKKKKILNFFDEISNFLLMKIKILEISIKLMVKTIQSSFTPSPIFDRVTESFDKLNNTDLFLQIQPLWLILLASVKLNGGFESPSMV